MTLTIVWLLKWNQIICDFFILLSGIRWKFLRFNFPPPCPLSHSFSSFPFSAPPFFFLSLSCCQLHNSLWYKQNYCSLIEKCSVCFQCLAPMPANLENSAVATGLEKVSFHSNPKERQCQGMFQIKLEDSRGNLRSISWKIYIRP